jgi:hypothetical protein
MILSLSFIFALRLNLIGLKMGRRLGDMMWTGEELRTMTRFRPSTIETPTI